MVVTTLVKKVTMIALFQSFLIRLHFSSFYYLYRFIVRNILDGPLDKKSNIKHLTINNDISVIDGMSENVKGKFDIYTENELI